MAGQVIGMNTAIYTQSSGSEGVGFAMPANIIINVYNMLIGPDHKVTRGSIGIQFQSNPSAVSREYGFANGGVLVGDVTPGKGAAKAGIQPDDVIVSIDGKPIKDGDQLVADISSRKVGSTVQLGYLRDGKQHTATVSIGDRSQLESDIGGPGSQNASPSSPMQARASSASRSTLSPLSYPASSVSTAESSSQASTLAPSRRNQHHPRNRHP